MSISDFDDYDRYDIYDGDYCPSCGSYNVKIDKSYEYADIDGNRGMWVRYLKCHDCGDES